MIAEQLIDYGFQKRCSDLHLTEGEPVMFRKNGSLYRSRRVMTTEEMAAVLEKFRPWDAGRSVDQSALTAGGVRFRIHFYQSGGKPAAAIRILPGEIPSMDQLGLPTLLKDQIKKDKGLVIVCGATGSGKSTTLAALIHAVNQREARHIITLEDPIEFRHQNIRSLIHQKELGSDIASFSEGLRSALREDPDLIMVGEMRDPATIAAGLTAAETGHLVLSTLHTESAVQAVSRIVDSFSGEVRGWIQIQLAQVLSAIVSQRLVYCPQKGERRAVFEALAGTEAVKNTIRSGKVHLLASLMETGEKDGMLTLKKDVMRLIKAGALSHQEAEKIIEKSAAV